MKIRPVGAELFHADRRTDRLTKLIVAFANFENAPKNRTTKSIYGMPVALNKVFGQSEDKCIQLDMNLTPCCSLF